MLVSVSYSMVCLHVLGDNSQALASVLSPIQIAKPWQNCFIPSLSMYTAYYKIFFVKV